MSEPYRMPKVFVGDRVLYYVDGDRTRDPQYGVIVGIGGMSLELKVPRRNNGPDQWIPDAIHVTDPRMNNPEIRKNGCWDYHPDTALLRKLREQVERLESKK